MLTALLVLLTLGAYLGVRALYQRYRHPLINVVGLSAALIIIFLLLAGIPHAAYQPACDLISSLLGAATVALALPLYHYRRLLRANALIIGLGVGLGSLLSMCVAGACLRLAGLPRNFVVSILPKGATMPFAIDVANMYGGNAALACAFVVATGTLGCLLCAWLMKARQVVSPLVRGLTYGCVAHGQGAGQALTEGEECGAVAGLAMILGGICTVLLAPLAVWLLGL